jgi:hypothetical protein
MSIRTSLVLVVLLAGCGDDSSSSSQDLSSNNGNPDMTMTSGDLAMADLAKGGPPDLIGVDVSCNPTSALGGGADPSATWTYAAACASDEAFQEIKDNCTSSFSGTAVTGPAGMPQPQGTLVLNSNGTFSREVHSTVSTTATISGTCAASGCAALQTAIATYASGATATCTGAGTCTCMISAVVNRTDAGTWSKSGATITANAGGGDLVYTWGLSGEVFRYRGDAGNGFGDHGVTYVLVK